MHYEISCWREVMHMWHNRCSDSLARFSGSLNIDHGRAETEIEKILSTFMGQLEIGDVGAMRFYQTYCNSGVNLYETRHSHWNIQ